MMCKSHLKMYHTQSAYIRTRLKCRKVNQNYHIIIIVVTNDCSLTLSLHGLLNQIFTKIQLLKNCKQPSLVKNITILSPFPIPNLILLQHPHFLFFSYLLLALLQGKRKPRIFRNMMRLQHNLRANRKILVHIMRKVLNIKVINGIIVKCKVN